LTGISLEGKDYTYQNPLVADAHHRWGWHDCPCCPPMFLKMVGAVPDLIYAADSSGITVNLFIGSTSTVKTGTGHTINLTQETSYPWNGKTTITVDPDAAADFAVRVRIPGWAMGSENPFALYNSKVTSEVKMSVNGTDLAVVPMKGYAVIERTWNKGDKVELTLPMEPRIVRADARVADLIGMVAVSSGPLVYCFENSLNKELGKMKIDSDGAMSTTFDPSMLGGVNVVSGSAALANGSKVEFKAIPYFAAGNLKPGDGYKVWANAAR
jgi:DUF1680 family protein